MIFNAHDTHIEIGASNLLAAAGKLISLISINLYYIFIYESSTESIYMMIYDDGSSFCLNLFHRPLMKMIYS